jgi:monoamine oxidase
MQTLSTKVVIIGGGLAGIYTAWRLQQSGIDFQLIEARDRLGGRILGETCATSEQPEEAFDLGPSWIWLDFQPNIIQLLHSLDLKIFEQYSKGMMVYEQAQGPAKRRDPPSAVDNDLKWPILIVLPAALKR